MRAARVPAALAAALGAVWALRVILGPILAALVIGPALWLAVIAAGWMLDRRLFAPPPPPPRRTGPVIDVPARQVR